MFVSGKATMLQFARVDKEVGRERTENEPNKVYLMPQARNIFQASCPKILFRVVDNFLSACYNKTSILHKSLPQNQNE